MQITDDKIGLQKKQTCISVKNVSFKYNKDLVLDNVSFSINNGDYLGVIGPNGGGKTTLIKIILGLIKPTEGEVEIFGEKISKKSKKLLLKIGYVPQRVSDGDFHFPATVREIVSTGRVAIKGLFKKLNKEDEVIINNAMETAEVTKYADRLMKTLSGGQRQKVFIARALAGNPKILILDEPAAGVDISSQEKFYEFLKKINQKFNLTIIFISHDIDVVANQAKSVLCLNNELVCHTTPQNFLKEEYMEKLYGRKIKFIVHDKR